MSEEKWTMGFGVDLYQGTTRLESKCFETKEDALNYFDELLDHLVILDKTNTRHIMTSSVNTRISILYTKPSK